MAESKYYPLIQKDPGIAIVDMMTTDETAHIGDWIFISGGSALVLSGARTSLGYQAYSGVGIALDQSPRWLPLGSAVHLTAMPVGIAGIFRVSAYTGVYTAGMWVMPIDGGSGVVGQTGRTGQAAIWSATNGPNLLSSLGGDDVSASAMLNSAVGRVLRRHAVGETGQIDIIIFPHLFGLGGNL